MATDTVIQLRELASLMERGSGMSTLYGAAKEIENLRAEIERLTQNIYNKKSTA